MIARLLLVSGTVLIVACGPQYKPGLPPGSPFAETSAAASFQHGVAVGDVTDHSALLWTRTTGEATLTVSWGREDEPRERLSDHRTVRTSAASDFTAVVPIDGLAPATAYRYRFALGTHAVAVEGRFTTAASPTEPTRDVFLFGADLGGQKHCRHDPDGYPIFDVMLKSQPAFALLLGDLIYADDSCPVPPNIPGADFTASTLAQYRAKHRYQREDVVLQRFLAAVPVGVMWDDHEVKNNFSGPAERLMPAGRQALQEYWPMTASAADPGRMYRTIRRGVDLELFLLDTRQYRSPNSERDHPDKTMLGAAQRRWLLEQLSQSTATWKVITSSVPLSNPKGGTLLIPGNDSWALGNDGTGFQHELRAIVDYLLEHRIRNVVWLTCDVHYAQVSSYDPDGDGSPDFHEIVAGPLSAAAGKPLPQHAAFRPTTLYADGGFMNFGRVTVDPKAFTIEIVDEQGAVRFTHVIPAR